MKKIKIKICNWNEKNEVLIYGHFLVKILRKYYDVEISDNPDYVFFSESAFEHLKYNCVKIFYTGENIHPNFNLCDYAIGFDYMDFGDRYHRLPLYLVFSFYLKEEIEIAGDTDFTKPVLFTRKDLQQKTDFCSFVYSNYLADNTRKIFFDKLSKYKKVNAGGRFLNNIGEKVINKLKFEMKHKFSITFENSSNLGYTTEKLCHSLAAKTIPIYFGNPEIHKEYNEGRFINCHRYKNFDEVIERIKEIDNNDDLYLSIINEPATVPTYNFKEERKNFETFLRNIVDQPLDSAKRIKINAAKAVELKENEMMVVKYTQRKAAIKKILAAIYQPFKKLAILEKMKQKYFLRKLKHN